MTNREVVSLWRHFLADKTGSVSVQNSYSPKAVLEYLKIERSGVVEDYLGTGKKLPSQMSQTISCLELVEVDQNDCPFQPDSGCKWLKTKQPIPVFITLSSVSSGLSGKLKTYDHVDWDKAQFKNTSREKGNMYTTKDTGEGMYIYLYDELILTAISITGIAEDPVAASDVCEDCRCDVLDKDFYINKSLLREVMTRAWQVLSRVRNLAGADIKDDDQPNEIGLQ